MVDLRKETNNMSKKNKVKIVLPNTNKKTDRIRLLIWIDSPSCATGFATVARGIFNYIAMLKKADGKTRKYDIDIIGVNDRGGWKNPIKYPYRIFPAKPGAQLGIGGDIYGRARLVAALLGKDPDILPPWDIVFTLNDAFILEQPLPVFNVGTMKVIKKTQKSSKDSLPPDWHFKVVSYWPVDSPLKANWVENSISMADYPVAYTKYGKEEIIKADNTLDRPTEVPKRLRVIYHGVDTDIFNPISDKEKVKYRKQLFDGKVKPETFLVTAVARNQQRKDLPRTMKIFKEFQKRRPDSFLYLHCQETDAWGSLLEYGRQFNLEMGKDWAVPAKFSANTGFPVEAMNLIYNVSDMIISTSLGEGFGFYNMEGFATKTPVLAPDNTVHPELFNYDKSDSLDDIESLAKKVRGIPYKSGANSSEWATYGTADYERIRPLGNVEDAVKKMIWIYDNPDKVTKITERAYKWVQDYSWKKISPLWDNLFTEVYNNLKVERKNWKPPKKVKKHGNKR